MKILFRLLTGLFCLGLLPQVDAQSFTLLHSFASSEGSDPSPYSSLATDGTALYGTARQRGPGLAVGTIYRVNLDGSDFEVLHVFTNAPDGSNPAGGLAVAGGTIYGSAQAGGPSPSLGMLYTLNTNGTGFRVLHSFHGTSDGETPRGDLLLVGDTLYGTTSFGGVWGQGVVFSVNTSGSNFTVLHNFTNFNPKLNHLDGGVPYAGLTLSGSTLYGTTTQGGTNGMLQGGTVFKLNTNGTGYAVLHSFTNYPAADGIEPYGRVVVDGDTIYGVTTFGGTNLSQSNYGTIFSLSTNGENFQVIHSFDPFTGGDGGSPYGGLTKVGGSIYGMASQGGGTGLMRYGTIFSFEVGGSGYGTIHSFTNAPTGATPYSELLLHNGSLYGTTSGGGPDGYGTVFAFGLPAQFSLQISNTVGGIFVSWNNNGPIHTLLGTTDLNGMWNTLIPNWSNGVSIGLQITNISQKPRMFFKLN